MEGKLKQGDECYDLWERDSHNLAIEIAYAIMCLLFVIQGVYAGLQRCKIAIHLDVALAISCLMPIGIWSD